MKKYACPDSMKESIKVNYRPEVPRGFQELRVPDYVTVAPDGGKVVILTHRLLFTPANTPSTHFC